MLITLEGPEASGKSTQISLITKTLTADGLNVANTREPGGTPLAEHLRGLIKTHNDEEIDAVAMFFLFLAARRIHYKNRLSTLIEDTDVVICDRYIDSTVVYQCLVGGVCSLDKATRLNMLATNGLLPDLTLLIDIPVDTTFERLQLRNDTKQHDNFDNLPVDFHTKVREGYLLLASLFPDRIKVINGDQASNDVHRDIMRVVYNVLNTKK